MTEHWTRDAIYGCDIWNGKLGSNGRPLVWRGKRPSSAYVVRWEEANGPVPVGMQLDHWCRRVRCVRLLHLEPVTPHENGLRKSWAYRCRIKLCPRGHTMGDALVTEMLGRLCRTCHEANR